jgi:hypothetical protein
MVEQRHDRNGHPEHPWVRHERTDVSFRAILIVIVGAMIFAAAMHFVLLVFFYDYRDYQNAIKKSPWPLAATPSTRLPPEPRLEQLNRIEQLPSSDAFYRELPREQWLDRYGPTNEEGYVHIPIGRAIDLLAGKLPARKPVPGQARRHDAGLIDAGEPNSGRLFREDVP